MSRVMAVRLPDGVAARVEEAASARGVRPGAWLKEAVAAYLDGGSPESPQPTSRRVDTVDQARQWALARQQKLNDAKGRSK